MYSTAHVQVYKKCKQHFVPQEMLKITCVFGLCYMRNTLLASNYLKILVGEFVAKICMASSILCSLL